MKTKRIAQYKVIENDLLEKIKIGYYKKGDMIPTELELSKTYQVSRVTVRKATDNLVAKGLLQRVSGVGTYVKNTSVKQKVPNIMGFTDEIIGMGMAPHTIVETFQLIKVPDNLTGTLGLEKDEMVYFIRRQRFADDQLFLLETTYMSARLYPDISIKILQGSKYHYFEKEKGFKIAYSKHIVTPIHPTKRIANLFGIAMDTPIIRIANTTYFDNGQVMDFTELTLNSPKYQLSYIKQ